MPRACIAIVLNLLITRLVCALGETAVITLEFPYGARQAGMGEVGVALADDESAVYYNPAGLGVRSPRWRYGSFGHFYEPLLPAFDIPDLWHSAWAGCFRVPHVGGFGAAYNYLNFGIIELTDAFGRTKRYVASREWNAMLAWGFDLEELSAENHHIGIGVNIFTSALAPGIGERPGEGVATSFAIDLGWLYTAPLGVRFGAALQNMGPAVWYINHFQRDPIPFTVNAAIGHKGRHTADGIHIVDWAAELRLDRQFAVNDPETGPHPFWKALYTDVVDKSYAENTAEIIYHLGGEISLFKTFSIRNGYLHDETGSRLEYHMGCGISLFNHGNLDWAVIYSPQTSPARHTQWTISVRLFNLGMFERGDLTWWKTDDERHGDEDADEAALRGSYRP
jgi:hypothetical protein